MVQDKISFYKLLHSAADVIAGFGVKRLGLFGSLAKGKATENSDVDLLVEFHSGQKNYDNFYDLATYLEQLCGRKVELVTPSSLSKFIGPHILKEAEYVSF